MEVKGQEPNITYGTLHYGNYNVSSSETTATYTSITSFADDFHLFAVEWDVYQIRWYVDDINYQNQSNWFTDGGIYPAPFDQPFFVILDLAIGGTFPGNPDNATVFPQSVIVDYVRVYSTPQDNSSSSDAQAELIIKAVLGVFVSVVGIAVICWCYKYRVDNKSMNYHFKKVDLYLIFLFLFFKYI
jgi:beta-glucanase (GH16 family)